MKCTYFLFFHLALVYARDLSERRVNNRDQYNNIFKTVPDLLEHIIDILQYKPQLLAKDDTNLFIETPKKYDIRKNDMKKRNDASYLALNSIEVLNDQEPSALRNMDIKRGIGKIHDQLLHFNKSSKADSNLFDFYNISNNNKDNLITDNLEISIFTDIFNNTDMKSKSDDDLTKLKDVLLTAEKIIEMTLTVEKLLEEYNQNQNRKYLTLLNVTLLQLPAFI